jgi:hypothetical protein
MTTRKKEDPAITAPGGIELTRSEVADAKHDGALDYVREGGGRALAADTGTTGDANLAAEAALLRVAPDLPTTFLAPLLNLPLEQLSPRLANDKVIDPIDFEQAKGLLALERAGQNRTEYVKALCERIGEEVGRKVHPHEVSPAGPAHTNDVTPVTKL